MTECVQCGDAWPRDRMLSLGSWLDPPTDPDLICPRCALVALRGGPAALSPEERDQLNVVLCDE